MRQPGPEVLPECNDPIDARRQADSAPGVYLKTYIQHYVSDHLKDGMGRSVPSRFKLTAIAVAPRLLWITPVEILGATYGLDLIVPIVHVDFRLDVAGLNDSNTGIGDIFFEPITLGWRKARYDLGVGYGVFMPTLDTDPAEPALPGKGFWTHLFTAGGTYYVDAKKTWSASLLARYEIHGDKDIGDVRSGDSFLFEWGVGKTLGKGFEVGIVGYAQWQVTDDEGADAVNPSTHDRVLALGPEIALAIPRDDGKGLVAHLALRMLWEFAARDRPEGMTTSFVFIVFF